MQNRKRDTDVQNRFFDPGKWQGWDVLREQHWNMYIIFGETDHQPRLGAWDKCSGLVHWEDPEGSGRLGWGIHVNPWLIHVNVWQKPLKYCKVISLQLIKINEKKKKKESRDLWRNHEYEWSLRPKHAFYCSYVIFNIHSTWQPIRQFQYILRQPLYFEIAYRVQYNIKQGSTALVHCYWS